MAEYLKPVESSISIIRETSSSKSLSDAEIVYTLGDRTETSEKESNYFSSFNLPYTYAEMGSGTTIAQMSPERFQLNTSTAVFVQISRNDYSEFIDGRSITIEVPQIGGTTKRIVSAFFSESDNTKKTNNDSILGENVAFLFCDETNLPYTGTTENTTINRGALTTWNPTLDFRDRPNAVAYADEIGRAHV